MRNQAFILKFKSARIGLRDHAVIINDTLQEKSYLWFDTQSALTFEHIFIPFLPAFKDLFFVLFFSFFHKRAKKVFSFSFIEF